MRRFINSCRLPIALLGSLPLLLLTVAGPVPADETSEKWDSKASAKKVVEKVGKAGNPAVGNDRVPVFVIEETHTSRLGQIETAIMLLRLYDKYGLRHIALEGHVEGKAVSAKWFHQGKKTNSAQRQIAVAMLAQGEISNAEFLAMVFPDVRLHPIEKSAEYEVKLQENDANALGAYLFRIALKSLKREDLSQAQLKRLTALAAEAKKDEKKAAELVTFVIGLDPWAAKKQKALMAERQASAIEDILAPVREVEKRAADVKAPLTQTDREAMKSFVAFFEARHKASATMVTKTMPLARLTPKAPVAMVIGAAHTKRVCQLLDKEKRPYVLLTPTHKGGAEKSALTLEAFRRKEARLSVDDARLIGALLDGRKAAAKGGKKAPPVLEEDWLKAKSNLALLTGRLARAAAGAGEPKPDKKPPFLSDDQLSLPFARVLKETVSVENQEVVFQVEVYPDNANRRKRFWVRAAYFGKKPEAGGAEDISSIESLEQLLFKSHKGVLNELSAQAYANQQQQEEGSVKEGKKVREPEKDDLPLIQIDSEVVMRVAPQQAAVKKAINEG